MAIDIKKLLSKKKYTNNSDELKVFNIIQLFFPQLNKDNFLLEKGVLRFKKIPSVLRAEIILKKRLIIKKINDSGVYLRDIL